MKTIYTEALADQICEYLAQGLSMVQISQIEGMPGLRTMMRWAAENEEFGIEYARAREAQAEVMDDMILSAAKGAKDDPQAARVKIDAYKWRAMKLAPKRYGDATMIKHADADGEKLEMDEVQRATRLASIFASIKKREAGVDGTD